MARRQSRAAGTPAVAMALVAVGAMLAIAGVFAESTPHPVSQAVASSALRERGLSVYGRVRAALRCGVQRWCGDSVAALEARHAGR